MTPEQQSPPPEPAAIFGVPLDRLSMDQVVERILAFRAQFAVDGRPRLVTTVNTDFLAKSLGFFPGRARHPELLDVLCRADLNTADGMPLVWLSRLIGQPLPMRVTGADLTPRLAKESGRRGLRLFFLGGDPKTSERAVAMLRKAYPDMLVAGQEAPLVATEGPNMLKSMGEDYALTQRINEARPDVLLAAFGNPKQELWFNRNRYRLNVPVTIGIGASLDFIARATPRAPLWMGNVGLEWLWRLGWEPGRLWRRYAADFFKLAALSGSFLLFTWLSDLLSGQDRLKDDGRTLETSPVFGLNSLHALRTSLTQRQTDGRSRILDLRRTRVARPAALGGLIRTLHQQADSTHALMPRGMNRFFRFFLMGSYAFASLTSIGASKPFAGNADELPRRFLFSYEHLAGDVTVVSLSGRLDAAYKAALPSTPLTSALSARRLVLAVRDLSFADSSGITLLLALHKIAAQNNRRLHVAEAHGVFRQTLALTRLDRIFVLHASRNDAIHAAGAE